MGDDNALIANEQLIHVQNIARIHFSTRTNSAETISLICFLGRFAKQDCLQQYRAKKWFLSTLLWVIQFTYIILYNHPVNCPVWCFVSEQPCWIKHHYIYIYILLYVCVRGYILFYLDRGLAHPKWLHLHFYCVSGMYFKGTMKMAIQL